MIVLATIGCFFATGPLFVLVGTDFVPKDDQSEFEVAITLPEGYSLDRASQTCAELEARLKQLPGVTNVFTTIGDRLQDCDAAEQRRYAAEHLDWSHKIAAFGLTR